MERSYLVVVFLLLATTNAFPVFAQNTPQKTVKQNQLIGRWYMGTMTGFDCNLKINANHTLTVPFGGCFHQGPIIQTNWKQQGDRIWFDNVALNKSLGSYLEIDRYKGYVVLLPERPRKYRGIPPYPSYSHYQCFWQNSMKNGLRLPKEASAWKKAQGVIGKKNGSVVSTIPNELQ